MTKKEINKLNEWVSVNYALPRTDKTLIRCLVYDDVNVWVDAWCVNIDTSTENSITFKWLHHERTELDNTKITHWKYILLPNGEVAND